MNSNRWSRSCWLAPVAFLCAVLLPTPSALRADTPRVEQRLDEADLNARRQAWIEDIHRSAPGTDWRAIENANRLETFFLRQARGPQIESAGWIEKGAANQTGRTFDCALGADGNLYVGSANGGVFRGPPLGGPTWTPLSDNVGYGVEHVVALGGPPVRLVVASNSRIFVSGDGGATWSVPTGLPDYISTVVRVVREADNVTTVYALVEGWIWTGTDWDHNWDLLRSTNGGASFARVFTVPLATRPDMWISRTAAGPLYLAYGNQIFQSTDHGVSFGVVGTLPVTADQTRLAGSEAGAPAFYCAQHTASGWTLYASTTGGTSWLARGALTDFYGTILASITSPLQVFIGGVNCYHSTDGGATLPAINIWYEYYPDPQHKLHADIFGMTSTMGPGAAGEHIYLHTDGGTFVLTPAASVPDNITRFGFRNAQYYGTLTSRTSPDRYFAGAQDQGYQISDPTSGTSTPNLSQTISGDYAHLVSSWLDRTRMVFSVYPTFVLVQTGPGDAPAVETTNFPSGQPGFKFLAATASDPVNAQAAYVGARQIWHVTRTSPGVYSWTALTFDFDHGDGDVVGALAMAPGNSDRWYAATYNGRLYASNDAGGTWTESATVGPPSHYFAGSGLVVSPTNPDVAWVCGSGYNNPGVYQTLDGGVTWSGMAAGLPQTQVYSIALDNAISQTPYVATQAGPFRWNGASWDNLLVTTCCAPLTDYWNVESIPTHALMRFSTYGRGVWDYATGSTLAVPSPVATALSLSVAPNPAAQHSSLAFELPRAGHVRLEAYDVLGRKLRTLVDGWHGAGLARVAFDHRDAAGRPLRAGLYLLRLETTDGVRVARLAIAR